ncbi:hypothetical protein V496_10280 [Pseudogymnoascus sp. VKM F-4515 (FW-2607)]|nr:hypothetical protein V496_10280 [Pseudogymnoascus sp. VKM F-4515 (FW-2607)]KFY92922.1 hypothetical protein V498_04663 [Pseudogymnoascus sp. VKM F-4517 (FW-2822)]
MKARRSYVSTGTTHRPTGKQPFPDPTAAEMEVSCLRYPATRLATPDMASAPSVPARAGAPSPTPVGAFGHVR